MKQSALVLALMASWLVGCTNSSGRTEASESRLSAHCSDLSRQIGEAANKPVRRSELQRRYDQECLAR